MLVLRYYLSPYLYLPAHPVPVVVLQTCNPANLEAEFQNTVGSVPVGGISPLVGGGIM